METRFNSTVSKRIDIAKLAPLVSVLAATVAALIWATPALAGELKVLKLGLGDGTVSSAASEIDCGETCDADFGSVVVFLQAVPETGSRFVGWEGDGANCPGDDRCRRLDMAEDRNVSAKFELINFPTITDFTPEGIRGFLFDNAALINSPARFLAALPDSAGGTDYFFRQNWILMSRSESLQTGVAAMPRLLLPSADGKLVFTIGLGEHGSYPGSHPNVIEYMQWDGLERNFRFHEIYVGEVPPLHPRSATDPTAGHRFPERLPCRRVDGEPMELDVRQRCVAVDDVKCFACHTTRNVPGTKIGTTGNPPGTVGYKSKPNWDVYDSWGGMLPFNRDRIYLDSVEEAAFRKLFNLWNYRGDRATRQIIEQLELQPGSLSSTSPHRISRIMSNSTDAGHIQFGTGVQASPPRRSVGYSFQGPDEPATDVNRTGRFVTLQHSSLAALNQGSDEGRGVQLFDFLFGQDGDLNAQRIADELVDQEYVTGGLKLDVWPIALAIGEKCIKRSGDTVKATSGGTLPVGKLKFFDKRNGMTISQLVRDTENRARSLPQRKADIQRLTFDRAGDPYLLESAPDSGLIGPTADMRQLRQEVFRRPETDPGTADKTVMGGIYADREDERNFERIALYRYLLEPLGVPVDKWSTGVRGRSRTYTFADTFLANGFMEDKIKETIKELLMVKGVVNLTCANLISRVNTILDALPAADNLYPTYTDIQRIFNKGCIECHNSFGYPPYAVGSLDLTEQDNGTDSLMKNSHEFAKRRIDVPPSSSLLLTVLLSAGTSEDNPEYGHNPPTANEACPGGIMPCGGPPLSQTDIKTIEKWIEGRGVYSEGDPHLRTIDGVNYDFQSAGEFVLLRDEGMELQSRQAAVTTGGPLSPDAHSGLETCASIGTAVALRIGSHRISYQPRIRPPGNEFDEAAGHQAEDLILRIDGQVAELGDDPLLLPRGGRILRTAEKDGIEVQAPGATAVVITPRWWAHRQLWHMNVNVRHARAVEGVLGAIAPNNWLPALPDGSTLGPRPSDLAERYGQLYQTFTDAWRVDAATSLFDYDPGQSPEDFVVDTWPMLTPAACNAPPQPGIRLQTPPQATMPEAEATELCEGLTEPIRRGNCVRDLMAAGDGTFADAYLATQRLEQNTLPEPPALVLPEDASLDLVAPVQFVWSTTTDSDGDRLDYRHCVWSADDHYDLNECTPVSVPTMTEDRMWPIGLILLITLLLLMLILRSRPRYWPLMLGLVLFGLVSAVWVAIHMTRPTDLNMTVAEFEPGKFYYWKAVAEDEHGRVAASHTRVFRTK